MGVAKFEIAPRLVIFDIVEAADWQADAWKRTGIDIGAILVADRLDNLDGFCIQFIESGFGNVLCHAPAP